MLCVLLYKALHEQSERLCIKALIYHTKTKTEYVNKSTRNADALRDTESKRERDFKRDQEKEIYLVRSKKDQLPQREKDGLGYKEKSQNSETKSKRKLEERQQPEEN